MRNAPFIYSQNSLSTGGTVIDFKIILLFIRTIPKEIKKVFDLKTISVCKGFIDGEGSRLDTD